MIKSLSAFAVLAILTTAVVALPGFAPMVQANEQAALAKGDRLDIFRPEACAQQIWPNLMPACLHGVQQTAIREARLVTAERR